MASKQAASMQHAAVARSAEHGGLSRTVPSSHVECQNTHLLQLPGLFLSAPVLPLQAMQVGGLH
eukprot:366301-Chlamydomonas_euryale.AAC.64